jgi:hypothetical protein
LKSNDKRFQKVTGAYNPRKGKVCVRDLTPVKRLWQRKLPLAEQLAIVDERGKTDGKWHNEQVESIKCNVV